MEVISNFLTTMNNLRFLDIVDILIVSIIIYKTYNLIKETRAEQLIKGLLAIFLVKLASDWLELYTISWILDQLTTYGIFTIIIVFQPELRRMLEYIGRSNIWKKSFIDIRGEEVNKIVEEIIRAVASLSRQKIGALIVFERKTGLTEVAETGTRLDSQISSELLINIFIPNTPLHDGAVIIKGSKIRAAACFLPLTTNKTISKELGTRHRAAMGVSEKSDCLSLIVSEETGSISVAENGKIDRYLDIETLREILTDLYSVDNTGFFQGLGTVTNDEK
ncbi:MAG: diadenylate cyclase CdaA [Tissierellia bacterium]|nr:diadenylate cyclase CdaA [Tissierellia bacterium]